MLLTTSTTIISSLSPNPQIQTQNHSIHHQNLKFQPKQPSICFNTVSLNHPLITDRNATISRFCKLNNLQKAIDLVYIEANYDPKTYCDILQLCADSKALNYGKKVHSLISSRGVEIDSVLGSKIVFMYVSCGDLREGRKVFDCIVKESVFVWNFMMNAYAKTGEYVESVCLFRMMLETGVEPNSYSFSCVFKCVAGDANLGETVHGCVLKLGFGCNNIVVNSLIGFYFKCGSVGNAHKVFVEMPDRDVVTFNSMISGYVANGLAEKGFEVFEQMIGSEMNVDLGTMVSVVISCANTGVVDLGRMVHAYAMKAEFVKEVKFSNTLLDMYSKCGDTDSAWKVFKNMNERSVVSWTSMIAGYTRNGKFDDAINLFLEMKKEGVKPDTFTVTSILHACASNGSLGKGKGKEVHDYIKENEIQSLAVSNALMDMYAKCGSMDDSYSVFLDTGSKDIVSWNTIIGGYSRNRLPNEALDLFTKMQLEITPDNVTMTCILPACASLAALDKGREIHGHVLRKGLTSDMYLVNALIDMYVKCDRLFLAKSLFDLTAAKNLVTWTVMIARYCMHGFGHEAVLTFRKMHEEGIRPNESSFASILYACSHSGMLQEGWRFYNTMVHDCKIEPKMEHYHCMVDLLSRCGKLSEAYAFIKKMQIKPDVAIWGTLLCGCRFHHDVKLAETVAERIFELEPGNTGYYVTLANIYSEAEKWQEIKTLRDRLRTNTACSWIEIKGKVNIFVTGSKDNQEGKKIESLLENLRMEMKENGFSGRVKHGLIGKDDAEKERAICGHSGMLAIGFGLVKLPAGRTVRVTKNVKVCVDCHEMAKFVSKNVGREIVLRDCNRFHHFKDGFCSCRGYG